MGNSHKHRNCTDCGILILHNAKLVKSYKLNLWIKLRRNKYNKSLQIKGDNIGVIYKIAMAYKNAGDTDHANEYFGEIIMKHPNSEFAAQAKEQRGF